MSTTDPLFVVAQSYQRYANWCREKGYGPHGGSVRYVRDERTLLGVHDVRVLCLEGWTDRVDWQELYNRILIVQRRRRHP